MALTQGQIEAIKNQAAGRTVIVYFGAGDTLTGVLVNVTADYLRLELSGEVGYVDIAAVKALRILE